MILILTFKVRGRRKIMKMGSKDAWLIGVAQGLAIIPGISRSGSTIGVGLLRGIDPETAGRYSFLLAIPSIVGAMILRIPDFFSGGYEIDIVAFVVGTLVAMIVGYGCLALLMRILKGKGFYGFAFYCWVAGSLVISAWYLGY
jgi:undecaprenyl-diphosphatase